MKTGLQTLWSLAWRTSILLIIWWVATNHAFDKSPKFAESNFVANQIRIQKVAASNPQNTATLAGSSLIGRINPEIVEGSPGFDECFQFGMDGGRTLLSLEIIDMLDTSPEYLILEANSLSFEATPNDKTLREHISDPVFKISQYFPWVKAENRPTTRIYDRLKSFKDRKGASSLASPKLPMVRQDLGIQRTTVLQKTGHSNTEADLLIELVEKLEVPWNNVLFVMLPNGETDDSESYRILSEIDQKRSIRILDLKGLARPGDYRYSDGYHLNIESGIKASHQIKMALSQEEEDQGK